MIKITPVSFKSIPASNWIFFSSKNAIVCFFKQNPSITNVKLAAIGISTANELRKYGKVSFTGSGSPKEVAGTFKELIKNEKVLFPVSNQSLRSVQKELLPEQVTELTVYKTESEPVYELNKGSFLVFTSPSNVRSFLLNNSVSGDQKIIAIGESTAKELYNNNIYNVLIPWQSSELAMADLLKE